MKWKPLVATIKARGPFWIHALRDFLGTDLNALAENHSQWMTPYPALLNAVKDKE